MFLTFATLHGMTGLYGPVSLYPTSVYGVSVFGFKVA